MFDTATNEINIKTATLIDDQSLVQSIAMLKGGDISDVIVKFVV